MRSINMKEFVGTELSVFSALPVVDMRLLFRHPTDGDRRISGFEMTHGYIN